MMITIVEKVYNNNDFKKKTGNVFHAERVKFKQLTAASCKLKKKTFHFQKLFSLQKSVIRTYEY